jgi:segregation and condensation protein B
MKKEVNLFELDLFKDAEENVSQEAQVSTAVEEQQEQHLTDEQLTDVLGNLSRAQGHFQQERQARAQVKRIIEALLFASSEPITFVKIREVTDTVHPFKPRVLLGIICELQHEYMTQGRSFRLEEIAQGFVLRTCSEYSPFIQLLYRNKRTEKLSQPAMEVLAIIAYRQPVTRQQIEAIRGVDCSGSLQTLLERQLVEAVGKLEVAGRPTLYGITKDFLSYFGLRDLKELPKLG